MTFANNGGPPQDAAANQAQLPQLNVLGQFVKDFSFENPNAPRSLAPSQQQPQLNVQINVGVNQAAPTVQVFIGNEQLSGHVDARIARNNQARDLLITRGVRR